jgi:hypothetical protein
VEDPWAAVEGVVWQLAAFEAEDRGLLDILANDAPRSAPAKASIAALMNHLGTVVGRAQAAGAMRAAPRGVRIEVSPTGGRPLARGRSAAELTEGRKIAVVAHDTEVSWTRHDVVRTAQPLAPVVRLLGRDS